MHIYCRPEKLPDSVIDYVVNYRKINPKFGQHQTVKHAHSPFILEGLDSASTYEVSKLKITIPKYFNPKFRFLLNQEMRMDLERLQLE